MATFTQGFRPAFNKQGLARLTFLGTGSQMGTKDDGTTWEIFKLVFEVMGEDRGVNQKVSIVTNYTYDEDNALGKTLKAMGFVPPTTEAEMVEDDGGFMVRSVNEDDEGFALAESSSTPDIEGFLKGCEGKVYLAKVMKHTEGKRKGFWEIDVESLAPFKKPE